MPGPTSGTRLRIFLCYVQDDRDRVQELSNRLLADGFDPWFDEENLLPGQDSTYHITKAVREADVFLACLSPHAISTTGHLHKQIAMAFDIAAEQPEGRIFIIPVRLEACAIPDRLSRWHVANLYEERGAGGAGGRACLTWVTGHVVLTCNDGMSTALRGRGHHEQCSRWGRAMECGGCGSGAYRKRDARGGSIAPVTFS